MLLLTSCPVPYRNQLQQSPPRWWQIQLILKKWLPSKTVAQPAAFARRFIPQISFPPDRRPIPSWQCFNWHFSPNCPPKVQKGCLFTFSQCCASRCIVLSRFVWCGLSNDITAWTRACSTTGKARSIATPAKCLNPAPFHSDIFLAFMLTWWDLCNTVIVLIIFSLLLIAHPNGCKQFPFLKRPRQHA